ncbi:3-beta hydroxysteroid-dehydrogenase/ decarboxylase-like protein isoform X1 [Tanacetum coccineum]
MESDTITYPIVWDVFSSLSEILLWRNMKLTLGAILALFAFYDNFVIRGYNMITAISMVFVMALAFLFIHGKVPDKLMGYSVDKIMESNFHITDTMSRQAALSVVSSWNHAACTLRSISSGTDSVIFFKTVGYVVDPLTCFCPVQAKVIYN